eukprot:s1176_g15.t1
MYKGRETQCKEHREHHREHREHRDHNALTAAKWQMPAPHKHIEHIEANESSTSLSPTQDVPNPVPSLPSGNLVASRGSKGNAGNATFKEDKDGASECFRLRHVQIDTLLKDGTLGLLLHGTSVVGFCSEEVADQGWLVGDQIVEINGKRVSAFDEFLERFVAAQVQGFPIVFSVLRREAPEAVESPVAKDPLDSFFSEMQFSDLASQLKTKFGPQPKQVTTFQAASSFGELSILENPYIQALRKRRSELSRSPEGWSEDYQAQSLAAKMASERGDALATLSKDSTETPRRYERNSRSPSAFDLFSCITAFRPCREKEAGGLHIHT